MVLLVLLVAAVAEIAAFVAVAHAIGVLAAIVLLVVVSALGPAIVRRVGLGVMAHTRARLDRGEPPTAEVLDGLVVLLGGALICVPGFIGDAVGLALMIRPVRRAAILLAGHRLAHRVRSASGTRWVIDAGSRPSGGPTPGGRGAGSQLPPPAG